MTNHKGFSKLELLISVIAMGIMVFFILHIMKRQQRLMVKAINDIEMTTVLQNMRTLLKNRDSCKASLGDKLVNTPKGEIQSLYKTVEISETDELEDVEEFPVLTLEKRDYGGNGLNIIAYSLEPDRDSRGQIVNLKIHFKILTEKPIRVEKVIQVYATTYESSEGKAISSCALNYRGKAEGHWTFNPESKSLVYEDGPLGVGTNESIFQLTVNRGIAIGRADSLPCNEDSLGTLRLNPQLDIPEYCQGDGRWRRVDQ